MIINFLKIFFTPNKCIFIKNDIVRVSSLEHVASQCFDSVEEPSINILSMRQNCAHFNIIKNRHRSRNDGGISNGLIMKEIFFKIFQILNHFSLFQQDWATL